MPRPGLHGAGRGCGYRDLVIRALLSPRWLGALLLSALFAALAYQLGHWQYGRHVEKVERNERITAHYSADPVPLETVLGRGPLPLDDEWTRVSLTGTFADPELAVRGRTFEGDVGYEMVRPFRLASRATVLVDRGWVPLGDQGAADVPDVAAPPADEATVTGWLRPGEASRGKASTPGQLASINLAEASDAMGMPLLGGYVQLAEVPAEGTGGVAPTPLGRPDRSLGAHQAYAYQWWLSMPLGFVLVFFGARRDAHWAAGRPAANPITANPAEAGPDPGPRPEREAAVASSGGSPAPADGARFAATPARSRREHPRKVRIWDEEDE